MTSPGSPSEACLAAAWRAASKRPFAWRNSFAVVKLEEVLPRNGAVDTARRAAKNTHMAEIEIAQLGDRLSDEEIVQLAGALEELGAPALPKSDDGTALSMGDIDDDVLTEFLDRLDAHDLAAEIYLPMEFDGVVEVAGMRVASAVNLIDVLDEMKDELSVEEEEDEDEEDDDDDEMSDADILAGQLKMCWRMFYDSAHTAVEKHLPMHV